MVTRVQNKLFTLSSRAVRIPGSVKKSIGGEQRVQFNKTGPLSHIGYQCYLLRKTGEPFREQYEKIKNDRFKLIDSTTEQTLTTLQRNLLSSPNIIPPQECKDTNRAKNLFAFIQKYDANKLSPDELSYLITALKDLKALPKELEKQFSDSVKKIKQEASQNKIDALTKLAEHFSINNLTAQETTVIFYALKEQGAFKEMVELYDKSKNNDFKQSVVIRELIAVALNKTGDLKRSKEEINDLIKDGFPSGEAYAILGKVKKIAYEEEKKDSTITADVAKLHLKESIDILEKGFKTGFELYPGMNLVYNSITKCLVEENGSSEKYKKAQRLAEMVYISCEKTGGRKSDDFWTLATMLEVSVILESDRVAKLLPLVLEKATVDWELQAPIKNLRELKRQIELYGDRLENKEGKIKKIDEALTALERKSESLEINSVHKLIASAIKNKDMDKLNRCTELAEVMYVAPSECNNDFWRLQQALKTALMLGQEARVDMIMPEILRYHPMDLKSLLKNIEQYKKIIEDNSEWLPCAQTRLSLFEKVNQGINERLEFHRRSGNFELAEITEAIFNKGFFWGEIKSNSVGGTIKYHGQLQDRLVNRWDFNIARGIVKYLNLTTNPDYNNFDEVIDHLIRERCKTSKMEYVETEEHKTYDEFKRMAAYATAAKKRKTSQKTPDSRTNIVIDFLLGQMDCRHHEDMKQLFFDVWKTENINNFMGTAYTALENNDLSVFEENLDKAKELAKLYMLSVNTEVWGREKNNPNTVFQKDKVKRLGPGSHSLNVLIKLDGSGNIAKFMPIASYIRKDVLHFMLVDSFHQARYRFGGKTDIPYSTGIRGIPTALEDLLTTGIHIEDILIDGQKWELVIRPSFHAGDRGKNVQPNKDDYGQITCYGIPVNKFVTGKTEFDVNLFFDPTVKTRLDDLIALRLRKPSFAA